MDQQEALDLIRSIRAREFEDAYVEVKAAHTELPKRLWETLSAFANQTDGGTVVLGLDEESGYAPVGVEDPQVAITQLTNVASLMVPPLRPDVVVVEVAGNKILVAEVAECPYDQKPCYYDPSGLNSGSRIRVGNTNRRMTDYEILGFISNRSQPTHDQDPVKQAALDDLDRERLQAYLATIRGGHPRVWERLHLEGRPMSEQLDQLGLVVSEGGRIVPTLASLLCFGVWPQRFFPSLTLTFVRYPGRTPDEKGPRGERFLDNCRCDGPLAEVAEQAVRRIAANMRQSLLVEGLFHRTLGEYPDEAVREAIINAVAHRDYSPLARGSAIRVEMYADRLEVRSPGGLYGPVNESNLEQTQSTRNQLVMRLLEDMGLVENRGSGIRAMIAAMRSAHLEPPRFRDTRSEFRVTFRNASLMDPESIRWLNQYAGFPLNDNQRMALVYLRQNQRMTNSDYRRLNNVQDTLQATRELGELADLGMTTMHGAKRGAFYALSPTLQPIGPRRVATPEEAKVLVHVRQHGSIARRECISILGTTPGHASYLLNRMCKRGELVMIGKRRWARYELPLADPRHPSDTL